MARKAIDSSGNSSPSIEDVEPISKIVSSSDFMRFKRGSNPGTGEFQTSIVTFTKNSPSSVQSPLLQVDLVSAVHVADQNYYTALQKEFELYDCVLFEMVTFGENLDDEGQSNGLKRLTGSRSRRFCIVRYIQRLMAIVLRLCNQSDCLNYRVENWYHADLDDETFQLLQRKEGENFFTLAIDGIVGSTKTMVKSMIPPKDIGPWRSKLLWASRGLSVPLLGLLWAFGVLSMPLIALFIGEVFYLLEDKKGILKLKPCLNLTLVLQSSCSWQSSLHLGAFR